ncbi:sorbin and SH3 domain-containing protein 1 homolog isoform X2 [Hydra vulgaris]|uniref:sorbin and SH3 domain-containing protein 1 homolog isoform X2 n=1 Tax=Hydra vulgaris TaxID=6087 RepID=UPI001F5F5385|nr:sorbin and SH3 domain-containing protein 1 homolog isoform X2 [Hydra vulgaris]
MLRSIRLGSYKNEQEKTQVTPGGKAEIGGVRVGDIVKEINGSSTENLYHTESLNAVKKSRYSLSLVLSRSDDDANVIQSIGIAPEEESTRVTLKIGPKTPVSSAPSSPKLFVHKSPQKIESFEETVVPKNSVFEESIPQGQSYMKRFFGSQENLLDGDSKKSRGPRNLYRKTSFGSTDQTDFDDLGPVERERSRTLPKNYSRDVNNNNSLNRSSGSLSQKGPPNKAPDWYKQMYKEINTSIEGESHLYKLLTSDAKSGVFRQYDGASSVGARSPRSSSPEDMYRSSTISTADVPRRLGGGRSATNNQHRKSLPNIHAANFNFMDPSKTGASTTVQMRIQKPSMTVVQNNENRKSINSEWYRQLQKGGQIPETGLTSSSTVLTIDNSKKGTRQEVNYLEDLIKKEEISKPSSVNIEYNNPPDFFELRKQELKNKEIEQEREMLREMREKERLQEEERLRKQKELDRLRVQAEEKKQKEKELEIKRIEEERKKLEYERKLAEEKKRLAEEERLKLPYQFAQAKYSFSPEGPGELKFKKTEIIHLLRQVDENWLEGELNGHVGIFPVSYIEYLSPDSSNVKETKSSSQTKDKKDSSLINGVQVSSPIKDIQASPPMKNNNDSTVLNNIKDSPSGKEAKKQTKELVKEESFIQLSTATNVESAVDSGEDLVSIVSREGLCKAKYTFKPASGNELPFRKGDMITIIRQVDENWFEGKFDDNIGIFPVNYVEVIKEPLVETAHPILYVEEKPNKQEEKKSVKQVEQKPVVEQKQVEQKPVEQKQVEQKPVKQVEQTTKLDKKFETLNEPKLSKSSDSAVPNTKMQYSEGLKKNEKIEESIPYTNGFVNSTIYTNGNHENDIDNLIGKGEPYRCVFSYKPSNDDEVDLAVGDIVYVLEKCDDGWFIGTSERTGSFGIFPGNYVKPV